MTTSGNILFELDRDQIIAAAYAKLGIPGEDNTLTTTQVSDGASRLNEVIALANTAGMPLWKRTITVLTPSTTSQVYTLTGALKLTQVVLSDISSGVQYDLIEKSLYDFERLPQGSIGTPVHYTFTPNIQDGTLSIWPLTSDTAITTSKTIIAIYQKEFDGVFSATDTLDFPAYWSTPIIYRLAVLLAPEYGVPIPDRQALKAEAKEFWDEAMGYGDEDGSMFIMPDRNGW